MRSLNRVMLIGNLGDDPQVHKTQTGKTVVTFSLATNKAWTISSGEKKEKTEFHRVVAWEKLAEICQKYLAKGTPVFVEGALEHRSYTDKSDVRRSLAEVVAETVTILRFRDNKTTSSLELATPETAVTPDLASVM